MLKMEEKALQTCGFGELSIIVLTYPARTQSIYRVLSMEGAPNTLYEGERFTLQFRFDDQYPFSSPEVIPCPTIASTIEPA